MAWKLLRPSILRTMWNSLLFGFLMSILTAVVVGIASISVYYLSYEWFFARVSIAIETRYLNIPVTAVWRRRWKMHVLVLILVAIINAVEIAIWWTTGLLTVV